MKKAFLDTNIAIAHVFQFNSLYFKSNEVFRFYLNFYWSNFVKKEFNMRYFQKHKNIRNFFNDLEKYFENPEQEFYSPSDLIDFARENYSGKTMNDAKSSVNPFWNQYIGIESKIPFTHMKNNVDDCLNDLSINTNQNKQNLEKIMQLTPQRQNNYSSIDSMLKSEGVSSQDRIVTLDGHDFACRSGGPVDFVTFDDDCYNGSKNVKVLCFNSIKGKQDFNAS